MTVPLTTGFEAPTIAEIVARVQSDFNTRFPTRDAKIVGSPLYLTSYVIAGCAWLAYRFVSNVARNVLPDTCDEDMLVRWGDFWGVSRTAATYAAGPLTFTGTNGTVIPAGTTVQRVSDQVELTTDAAGTIAAGTVNIDCTAVEAGEDANCDAGTAFILSTPIVGIDDACEVQSGDAVDGGTDEEDTDSWRERILLRIQNPSHDGAIEDWAGWAQEAISTVDGTMVESWIDNASIPDGYVWVWFWLDGTRTSDVEPSAGNVTSVQNTIDEVDADGHYIRKPVGCGATAKQATGTATTFTLELSDDTTDKRAAVVAELESLFARRRDVGATIYESQIDAAIQAGIDDDDYFIRTVPAADVTSTSSQIPTIADDPGAFTWV